MGQKHSLWEILWTAFKLGLTSFGGPVAHLGYFKNEYVDKRKWLDDRTYADIIALCQFPPGPASSQVGISIGMLRGGLTGGILAWFGFTIPSVVVLVLFALVYQSLAFQEPAWILSLKVVAVAVVAHAVLGLGKKLTPDKPRIAIALAGTLVMLLVPSVWMQIGVIVASGFVGWLFLPVKQMPRAHLFQSESRKRWVQAL
ncbi:putative chromate transport protein [Lentibacillus sp. JNUCC-1]|nr:putative chromate transport protein [Lentibacillus sp. JNUCC-1]